MEIHKADYAYHKFRSLWDTCPLWNKSKMCIVWSVIHYIQNLCMLYSVRNTSTTIFDDNDTCITQIIGGYIKRDKIKPFRRHSSLLMSSRRAKWLKSSRYSPLTIFSIALLKLCPLQPMRRWYIVLACADLTEYRFNLSLI